MRSPIGPVLILLGVATTVVLVLLLFQTIGLRSDLERTRAEVATLQAEVAAQEVGVTDERLGQRLDDLESGIRDWLIATGVDGPATDGSPAGGGTDANPVLDRLDEILERINALDERIDEICDGVPVC